MFEDKYKSLMNDVNAPENLVTYVLEKSDNNKMNSIKLLKKPVMIFSAICLCTMISFPATAAYSRDIYKLMYFVSPEIAQLFRPVQLSCEDNGIKMEVLSVYTVDNEIQVCIAMQDMTGNRVDETIDLYDSYRISSPFDSGYCTFSEYNPQTKTATFIVCLSRWEKAFVLSDRITFSVSEFLSGKMHYENIDVPVDLKEVKTATKVFTPHITGGGGTGLKSEYKENVPVLVPATPLENFTVDGVEITAIGYIDGKLHVQTAVKNRAENDNHGFLWLVDEAGSKILYDYSLSFKQQENGKDISYDEYVFDIPKDNIAFYRLQGEFWISTMITKGNWNVTFEI